MTLVLPFRVVERFHGQGAWAEALEKGQRSGVEPPWMVFDTPPSCT